MSNVGQKSWTVHGANLPYPQTFYDFDQAKTAFDKACADSWVGYASMVEHVVVGRHEKPWGPNKEHGRSFYEVLDRNKEFDNEQESAIRPVSDVSEEVRRSYRRAGPDVLPDGASGTTY